MEDKKNCGRCGCELLLNSWGGYGENSLNLKADGGYSDMVDTVFDTVEQECTRWLVLCHKCGHKLINWVGNTDWINPTSTGSHSNSSDWHYGWSNRTWKGYVSCFFNYLIHFSLNEAIEEVKRLREVHTQWANQGKKEEE
tara:strand:+ start:175 stop:594 length:420 start_codon:yes stop_codon:yes gene_type:complete